MNRECQRANIYSEQTLHSGKPLHSGQHGMQEATGSCMCVWCTHDLYGCMGARVRVHVRVRVRVRVCVCGERAPAAPR